MSEYNLPSRVLEKAVHELSKLPGIGQRTALRLALHLLNQKKEDALQLGLSLVELVEETRFCENCHNISESDLCQICSNQQRDHST
ncbi:MAG TPA: recombination protein RecR, partial [Salinivirgaceae bacterium]|nr:recombination protein RecR [Salinivirgaceae bacterium]